MPNTLCKHFTGWIDSDKFSPEWNVVWRAASDIAKQEKKVLAVFKIKTEQIAQVEMFLQNLNATQG